MDRYGATLFRFPRALANKSAIQDHAAVVLLTTGLLFLATSEIAPAQAISGRKILNPESQLQPDFRLIASGRQRITRDKQTVAISRGSYDVVVD
jgi:hypothetical protein